MTEAELIKGCLKKDTSCQHQLFTQYAGKLMTVCLRYASGKQDAEDILQEAFVIIFRSLHQYRGEGALDKWMKRIVINCALRWIEKKKIRFSNISSYEATDVTLNDADALSSLSEEELLLLICELPNGYRIVFNLYVMEGYSHSEIAEMLNIKPVTSRSQLLQAKRWLQQKILSPKMTL